MTDLELAKAVCERLGVEPMHNPCPTDEGWRRCDICGKMEDDPPIACYARVLSDLNEAMEILATLYGNAAIVCEQEVATHVHFEPFRQLGEPEAPDIYEDFEGWHDVPSLCLAIVKCAGKAWGLEG